MPYAVSTRNQAMGAGKNSVSLQTRIARSLLYKISNKTNGKVTALVRDALENLEERGIYVVPWHREDFRDWVKSVDSKGYQAAWADMKPFYLKMMRETMDYWRNFGLNWGYWFGSQQMQEKCIAIVAEYVDDNVLAQVKERLPVPIPPSGDTESSSA